MYCSYPPLCTQIHEFCIKKFKVIYKAIFIFSINHLPNKYMSQKWVNHNSYLSMSRKFPIFFCKVFAKTLTLFLYRH